MKWIAVTALAFSGCSAPAAPQETRVVIGGDTHFGESYRVSDLSDKTAVDLHGYDWSLVRLRPLLARADFTLVNLETPLTLSRDQALEGKDYVHWSDPEKAPTALSMAGIDAVGLANNHTLDMGQQGLADTLASLDRHTIARVGAGPTKALATAPLLKTLTLSGGKSMTLAVFAMFEERPEYVDKFHFYASETAAGVAKLDTAYFARQVRELRARIPTAFVIAYPHWGQNYQWRSKKQKIEGRALIDAGADMVIGSHAHCLQEIEAYRGKWILYGIGNLMFNAPGRFAEHRDVLPYGAAVELAFTDASAGQPLVRLYPFRSDNSVTGFQPTPATRQEVDRILASLEAHSRNRLHAAAVESSLGTTILLPRQ